MKKLIALTLLCLPLVCQGGGIVKKPTRRITFKHSAGEVLKISSKPEYHPARVGTDLSKYVLRAMNNSSRPGGLPARGRFYAKPYVSIVKAALEQRNGVAVSEKLYDSAVFYSRLESLRPIGKKYERPTFQDMGELLFSKDVAGEFFGSAFLIKGKEGQVKVALPLRTSMEISLHGQPKQLHPFSYVTLSVFDEQHIPLLSGNEQPLPLHQMSIGAVQNIELHAFTPKEAAAYALDPKASLFEVIHKRSDGTPLSFAPKQRMLFKDSNGLWMLTPEDRLGIGQKGADVILELRTWPDSYSLYKLMILSQ